MARFRLLHLFPNGITGDKLLTGELLSGSINPGDTLLINETKILAKEVELNSIMSPEHVMMLITIPEVSANEVKWDELYGNQFEIENHGEVVNWRDSSEEFYF